MFEAPLILDATAVIYLAKSGVLDCLSAVEPQPLYVGEYVLGEARFYRDAAGVRCPVDLSRQVEEGILMLASLEDQEELQLFTLFVDAELGNGEAEAFAIAAIRGWIPVTDDRVARVQWEVEETGCDAIGTPALLGALVAAGALSDERRSVALKRCFPRGLPRRK